MKQQDLTGTIEVLFEISDAVTHTRNLDELYQVIHCSLDKIIPAKNFCIALFHEERDAISFPYKKDEKNHIPHEILNFSQKTCFTGRVIKAKIPMVFSEKEILQLAEELGEAFLGSVSKSWLGAPLIIKDRVIGAMVIQDYDSATVYEPQDLDLLNSVSQHVALAIERKEAEEKIKDQGKILNKILESSPVGIALVQNRVFKWVNQEMVRMFGYGTKQELQNKSAQIIYKDVSDYESAGKIILNSLVNQGRADYDIELKKKEGQVFPAHIRVNCADSKDPMAWTIASFTDISLKKAAEKEIYERERLQGVLEMAGAVCHEINQPLQAILGYCELLLMGPEIGMVTGLSAIKSQVARLGRITQKLAGITQYKTLDYPGNTKIVDIWGSDRDTRLQEKGEG